MNWRTLLVPHDYSPCADRALAVASELARKHGSKLVLLHVTHLPPGLTADAMIADRESGEMRRVDDFARIQALAELDQRAQRLESSGVQVEIRTAIGDIVDEILGAAEDVKADLIVMGTHGRTGLAHLFIGSMTEKVLRQSPVPVLTVREHADQIRTTSEIVVTDLATD
jgi:universal stress protein A